MGQLMLGRLLLGKLVTEEVSVGEIIGWGNCYWRSFDWGNCVGEVVLENSLTPVISPSQFPCQQLS